MDPGPSSFSCNLLHYFLFCSLQKILFPHGSFNPLFSAKPVSLTTSLKVGDKVLGWLCAGLHVAADAGSAPCHELVRNTSGENIFLLLVDKPWFLTEGKLPAMLIIPSSWGSTQHYAYILLHQLCAQHLAASTVTP